jgi:D-beta-D-heptose 7-phosphate kinase/D-beta-D-heptose 1-phosphate adenosyltransferase
MSALIETVRRFRGLRALVVGDAMLDSYVEGSAARLCSEGPVPVVRSGSETCLPGGAANTSANLAALGASVRFVGVTGEDEAGRMLRAALVEAGVSDRWLLADERVTTLHKRRILADGQYVVRVDDGDTRAMSSSGRRMLLDRLTDAFHDSDVVVVSDYGYGVLTDEVIAHLGALRLARPCVMLVDSKQLQRFAHSRATVITPNHLEAQLLAACGQTGAVDASHCSLAEAERVGRRLLELIDSEHVAVTLAANGVLLLARVGAALHLPAQPVAHANDVGAGDSFAAALALALAAGAACPDAARIAVAAAGISVARARTSVVGQQELLQRVSLRELPVGQSGAVAHIAAKLLADRLRGKTIVFTNGVFDILHAGHVDFLRRARELGHAARGAAGRRHDHVASGDRATRREGVAQPVTGAGADVWPVEDRSDEVVLIVGVNSDRSARRLKGRGRPINSERDRLGLIAALDMVDHAVLFDEDDPSEMIRALQPHIHVKGGDYADVHLPEEDAVREVSGRVVILPLVGGHSTTGLIDRIVQIAVAAEEAVVHD